MTKLYDNYLSSLLLENTSPRLVESNIYSVLQGNKSGNEYDAEFGFFYDWVASNPIYNCNIWDIR